MAHSLTGISSPTGKIMIYHTAVSVPWHVAIYEPVHNGWGSPDVAGTALLDRFAAESDPAGNSRVLKLRPGAVEASDINRRCSCDEYQSWFDSTRLRIDAPLGGRPSYQWPAARRTAKEKP